MSDTMIKERSTGAATVDEKWIIKILGLVNGSSLTKGLYLKSYDPTTSPPGKAYPTGTLDSTDKPSEALQFDSMMEAYEFWQQQHKSTPIRPDGKPNRPLTAFHVEILPLSEEIEF